MRHRHRRTPKKPFDDATSEVNLWERRVCYSTVTTIFDIHDVVTWLYPAEPLAVLREAFKLTSDPHPDRRELINFHHDGHDTLSVEFQIDCDEARICTPKGGLLTQQQVDTKGIVAAVYDYARIVDEWNIVREVVDWFNENATPACARYYFPAIGNFLDSGHAFHHIDGVRFAEPKQSIGVIAAKVRQAAEIVTMATFCPQAEKTKERTGVTLTILRKDGRSQPFFF